MHGIECYVSDHAGFFGKVKEKHEDFEVKEIDLEGNIAQPPGTIEDSNGNEDGGSARFKAGSKKDIYVPMSSAGADVSAQVCDVIFNEQQAPNPVGVTTDCPINHGDGKNVTKQKITFVEDHDSNKLDILQDKNPHEFLAEYLDASVLSQLDSLKFDPVAQFPSSDIKNLEISIGIVNEKRIRTMLHQCIRHVYPHLKTVVSKTSVGHSEIIVLFDSAYGDFLDIGIGKEVIDDLFKFVHCQLIMKDKSTFVAKIGENKEQRTHFHRLIRQHFGSFLESKTFSSDDRAMPSEINVRFRSKRKLSTERLVTPKYKFILCKRNIELSDAILKLSHSLKTKPSAFSFAGTKDKKAVTYQYVTTNEVDYGELERFAKSSERRDVEVFGIEKAQDMLRLGDLRGNMFKLVLRDARVDNGRSDIGELIARIKAALSNVSVNGFVNYFGEQRFGFEDNLVGSADIGLAMLRGNFVKAVDLILSPTGQGGDVDDAKKYFQDTKDVVGTSKRMPVWKTRESSILRSLKQHGYSEYGCCQALQSLPYNVRLMYVHSYSSLVWNRMASKRIKMYGVRPAVGDIVLLNGNHESPVILGDKDTEKYNISDIVLPLPGFRVTFPSNLMGDYERALREDGVERENFRIRKIHVNVPGVYRKLISYPEDLCWGLQTASDACNGQQYIDGNRPTSRENRSLEDRNHKQEFPSSSGEFQANVDLKLQFSLVSSSYATVCLREIMHNTVT